MKVRGCYYQSVSLALQTWEPMTSDFLSGPNCVDIPEASKLDMSVTSCSSILGYLSRDFSWQF